MARSLQFLYMPLLQSIVEEFDRELVRLHTLRSIIAGLSSTPEVVARVISSSVVARKSIETVVETVVPASKPPNPPKKFRADAGKPRERRTPKLVSSPDVRAFAATVPSGPVVFNPIRLAEEKAQREQSRVSQQPTEPVHVEGDLETLTRTLAARWSTGLMQ